MPICLEIAVFPTSEAYRKDIKTLDPGLQALSKADGLKSIYHGVQVEDPKTGYAFNTWDTIEHHMKLVGDPSYPELIKTMVPAFSGVLGVIHVNFPAELDAFDQPVTSVTLVTTKTAEANEKVLKLLGEMSELSKGKIHVGQTVESLTDTEGDNVVLVTAGWENVEAHFGSPRPPQAAELASIASAEIKHVKLTKFL